MKEENLNLLKGVNPNYIIERLKAAGGNEVESGKFLNPESSSALAVNSFAFYNDKPDELPSFPNLKFNSKPISVDIEYSARFPWRGGKHPWLDVFVETKDQIFGIESKRFEPYRDAKNIKLSEAYWRPVWGDNMKRFEDLRDKISKKEISFKYLDAVQLIKHGFGLVTEGKRKNKRPFLVYLFAEPKVLKGKEINKEIFKSHRIEAQTFKNFVNGDTVEFEFFSYKEWLNNFTGNNIDHAKNIIENFAP